MPSNRTVTPRKVRAIFTLHKEGKSWSDISGVFGQSRTWAIQVSKRYDPITYLPLQNRGEIGRPRKFGDNLDNAVDLYAKTFRDSNSKDITSALKNVGIEISARTIQRYLKNLGFRKVGAIKDVLTADHKARRVAWCLEKQRELILKPNMFHDWLISDEVRVSLDGQCRPQVCLVDWLIIPPLRHYKI
jgi:transposase